MSDWAVEPYGPDAWLVRFGGDLSAEVMARAVSVSQGLEQNPPPSLREFTMGYASVLLEFGGMRPEAGEVAGYVRHLAGGEDVAGGRVVDIPVFYEGPDLEEVAARTGLTRREVIECHAGREYFVWLLGFSPGFPYMGVVEEVLQLPRRATPRPRVPAGSVAIAGAQTGVYPAESAGGWHLLGRTESRMFDARRTGEEFLLRPGDRVRFIPVEGGDG